MILSVINDQKFHFSIEEFLFIPHGKVLKSSCSWNKKNEKMTHLYKIQLQWIESLNTLCIIITKIKLKIDCLIIACDCWFVYLLCSKYSNKNNPTEATIWWNFAGKCHKILWKWVRIMHEVKLLWGGVIEFRFSFQ